MRCEPTSAPDQGDSSMKSVREHMDMHAAYREVGSYRAAADICGTTPKTVKRSVEAARTGRGRVRPRRGPPQLRRRGRPGGRDRRPHQGPDHGQAAAAGGEGRRLRGLGPQLPPAGGRGEGQLEVEEPPGPTTGGVGARRHGGLRLGGDRPAVRLLCGGRLEPVPLRLLHRQPRGRGHHGGTGRVLRAHRRCARRPRSPTGWAV